MSEQVQPGRRFLGRPEAVEPGYVPPASDTASRAGAGARARSRAGRLWLLQALTGAMLVGVLAVHLVAQHFLAPGGLRDYASVVEYLRQPLAAVIEVMLLGSVVVHVCLGLRSSLVDVLGEAALRRVSIGLAFAGVVAIAYGLWLVTALLTAPA
jgi:succinate dehydrogenase hydrophobic anchor subunit